MDINIGERPILTFYKSLSDDKWVACQEDSKMIDLISPELEDLLELLKEKHKLVESLLKKIQSN